MRPWPEQPGEAGGALLWTVLHSSPATSLGLPLQRPRAVFIHGFPQEVFLEPQQAPSSFQSCPDQLCPVSNRQGGQLPSIQPEGRGGGVTSHTASAQVWCTDFRGCGELDNLSVWCDALEKEGVETVPA